MQAGREIEVRAWDDKKKRMYDGDDIEAYDYLITGISYGKVFVAVEDPDWRELKVIQFTGLHDKNGKKIYEGDIALIYGDRCVIEYDSKSASYVARTKIDSYWALDEETFKLGVEVIGNIYENPDLLRSA